jgi:hypothetical protein
MRLSVITMMGRAEDGQQDAQAEGEVARAGPRRRAEVVGGGPPREGDARDDEHEAGPEVLLALELQAAYSSKDDELPDAF